MIVDCIGCLHGNYPKLEGGDLLIVTGDLTATDSYQQNILFRNWIDEQDYIKKIFIAGNHDNLIQNTDMLDGVFYQCSAEYLCDSGTEFECLKIWGSPWTKTFHGMNPKCKAFTCDTEEELAEKFVLIPDNTDILITHSPPYSIMDSVKDYVTGNIKMCGSTALSMRLLDLDEFKLHCFSHIHEGYGIRDFNEDGSSWTVNCSHVDERYRPVNKPIRIVL